MALKVMKSKARTAYALLTEIQGLILAEPKRYNQHDTLCVKGIRSGINSSRPPKGYPKCGTVGCVAGWVCALKHPHANSRGWFDVLGQAERILGLTPSQRWMLFSGGAADGKAQTGEHAKSGAAHIKRFQRKYAAKLKAKRV